MNRTPYSFSPNDAVKSKGDNEICPQHSEANALGFAFIVNETQVTFSIIHLKMDHEIHVQEIKRSYSFPKYVKHNGSLRQQENFNT